MVAVIVPGIPEIHAPLMQLPVHQALCQSLQSRDNSKRGFLFICRLLSSSSPSSSSSPATHCPPEEGWQAVQPESSPATGHQVPGMPPPECPTLRHGTPVPELPGSQERGRKGQTQRRGRLTQEGLHAVDPLLTK